MVLLFKKDRLLNNTQNGDCPRAVEDGLDIKRKLVTVNESESA